MQDPRTYGGTMRVYEHGGNVYVIRDVDNWDRESARCEYAVKREGVETWVSCKERVAFADIQPYCTAKEWRQPFTQDRIAAIVNAMNARAA